MYSYELFKPMKSIIDDYLKYMLDPSSMTMPNRTFSLVYYGPGRNY